MRAGSLPGCRPALLEQTTAAERLIDDVRLGYVFVSLGQALWLESVAKRGMIDGGEPELTGVVNRTMVAAPPR